MGSTVAVEPDLPRVIKKNSPIENQKPFNEDFTKESTEPTSTIVEEQTEKRRND